MKRLGHGPEKAAEILAGLIPPAHWAMYAPLFPEGARRGISFAIGGGLAVSAYSGYARYTKDMDLFVREEQSGALLEMLDDLGFKEYTEFPYDRTWSYRSFRDGAIVDVLWKTLNGKVPVNERWLTEGWALTVRETPILLIPVEELIVAKLYILKGDRTDWPDILNLLFAQGERIQWARLLEILGDDDLLLGSVMGVFRWLCPGRACLFPDHLWKRLGLLPPAPSDLPVDWGKVALLAAKNWFPGGGP